MMNEREEKAGVATDITFNGEGEEFSPYRQENTSLHHYKDQLVNAV
jgi:hypothetical protein